MGRRIILALVLASIGAIVVSAPVAAYKHLGTTGNTGTHSLTDTRSRPGASAQYRYSDEKFSWVLRHLDVRPPNVEATLLERKGDQQVGWSFTVDRKLRCLCDNQGEWEHRYTSPIQKRITDADHDADFTPMGVRVIVPRFSGDPPEHVYYYRVIVNVFWYRNNGTVSGTARMRVEWFKSTMEGDHVEKQRWSTQSWCYGVRSEHCHS